MSHLTTFLRGLLLEAGFTEDDNLQLLQDDLQQVFLDRMNAQILAQIPQEKWEEASALLLDEDTQKWEDFIQLYIPEYDDFLAKIYDDFAQEYLESMQEESE